MAATTYRGNRKRMAALAFLAFYAWTVTLGTGDTHLGGGRTWVFVICGLVIAVAIAVFAWMMSLRLTLRPDGLSYRSLAGSRDIAWADVEKIYRYSAGWIFIHFIPVSPPNRHVIVVTKDGARLRLGDSFADAVAMIDQVVELTRPFLYRRMLDELNRGGTVDLGAVRISRMTGIELKTLFGFEAYGFDEIERYGVDDNGKFRIWRGGGRASPGVPAERVANLNALMDVIGAVFHGDRSKPAAFALIDEPSAGPAAISR